MSLFKRRLWLALVAGAVALLGLWFASAFAEPMLIALALGPAEPRSSASGWANSNVWLASVAAVCLVLLLGGYIAKRFSQQKSWFAPVVLMVVVLVYVFFAQFPATRSALRIALWSIALPASVSVGRLAGLSRGKCGLTHRSSRPAPAGRFRPSFHSGPKPSCLCGPLNSNVRPHRNV